MEQFNLEKWLQDKSSKVVTRDGRPARIVCTDLKNDHPIIAAIKRDNSELPYYYDINGKCLFYDSKDLFFADEENTELTEFEKAIYQYICTIVTACDGEVYGDKELKPIVKEIAKDLLDLTRKELEKENSEFKPKFTYNEKDYSKLANKLIEFRNNTPLCSVSYRDGEGRKVILHYEKEIIELVKKEILKDFPKWKKSTEHKDLEKHIAILEDGKVLLSNYLEEGDYYIELEDLKKLPKEE